MAQYLYIPVFLQLRSFGALGVFFVLYWPRTCLIVKQPRLMIIYQGGSKTEKRGIRMWRWVEKFAEMEVRVKLVT